MTPGAGADGKIPFGLISCTGSLTMSILGKIMGAIFGNHAEAATPTSTPEAGGGGATSSSSAAAVSNVDVAAILDKAVARKKEKLACDR